MRIRKERIMAWGEAKLHRHLVNLQRRDSTFRDYGYGFAHMRQFFWTHRTKDYDPVLMECYRRTCQKQYEEGQVPLVMHRLRIRLSRYMDNVYNDRQINELPGRKVCRNMPAPIHKWPPNPYTMRLTKESMVLLKSYRSHLEGGGMGARKVGNTAAKARILLAFLESNGIVVAELDERIVSSFLHLALENGETYSSVKGGVENFSAWLGANGLVLRPLDPYFLRLRQRRNRKVGHAFSDSDVKAMLASIDRGTAEGKMEFAFIALMAGTGIRGCDAAALRVGNIDIAESCLRFTQKKTQAPCVVALLPEVMEVLLDYIHNARGDTEAPELFIDVHTGQPYRDLRMLLYRILERAGIDKKAGDGIGLHSFRRALGGRLLEAGVEPSMMTQLLGHRDPRAFVHYIPMATERLRQCALSLAGIGCSPEVYS